MFDLFYQFLSNTGYFLADYRHVIMIFVGCIFLYLGTAKKYEPLLLVPIGFGILVGNVPFFKGFGIGIYEPNSVLHYLYFGVTTGVYPSIVFLGLGAMTDFSSLLAQPKLMLLGAAAQMGIYFTLLGALFFGFLPKEAASIAIIGGADGPTSIFLNRQTCAAPHRAHCHCGLFIHGADTGYSAADNEAVDHPERTPYKNAGRPGSFQKGTHYISGGGSSTVLFSGPDRTAVAGYAVFGEFFKRMRCGESPGQYSPIGHHRYGDNISRVHGGLQHPGRCVLDAQIFRYFLSGCRRIFDCHRLRCYFW